LFRQIRYIFLAGIFSALSVLANATIAFYILGLGFLILVRPLPYWRQALRPALAFFFGFFSIFLFFEGIKWMGIPQEMLGTQFVDSPWKVLAYYGLRVHRFHHFVWLGGHVGVPKYPGMLFFILKHVSWILLGLSITLPLVLFGWTSKIGWHQTIKEPMLKACLILWLPLFVAVLLLDIYPGVQVGRSYHVAFPLLILGILILWQRIARIHKRWALLGFVLFIGFILETGVSLAKQRQAFHGVRTEVSKILKPNEPIAMLTTDYHYEDILYVLGEDLAKRVVPLKNMQDLIPLGQKHRDILFLAGPEIETVLFLGKKTPFRPIEKEGQKIPFYGLYPLLILEDEGDQWRYINKEFDKNAYRNGPGAVTLWPLFYETK